MKIADVAKMTGATKSTVLHYHRIGLMVEPPRGANGYRIYHLGHALRLMRIRALVERGVPLGSIVTVLAADNADPREIDREVDLRALIADVERQRQELATRSAHLVAMLDDTGRDNPCEIPGQTRSAS